MLLVLYRAGNSKLTLRHTPISYIDKLASVLQFGVWKRDVRISEKEERMDEMHMCFISAAETIS